jgi:hypothetical protein
VRLTLNRDEIGQAVSEYLYHRGMKTDRSKMSITYKREEDEFYVIVDGVEYVIPPQEGPYR